MRPGSDPPTTGIADRTLYDGRDAGWAISNFGGASGWARVLDLEVSPVLLSSTHQEGFAIERLLIVGESSIHTILFTAGIWIIEGVNLSRV